MQLSECSVLKIVPSDLLVAIGCGCGPQTSQILVSALGMGPSVFQDIRRNLLTVKGPCPDHFIQRARANDCYGFLEAFQKISVSISSEVYARGILQHYGLRIAPRTVYVCDQG
jgi:hypothetical protein